MNEIALEKNYDILRDEIRDLLTETPGKQVSHEAITQAEDDLIGLAQDYALAPPPALRNKVLDKIRLLNAQKKQRQTLDIQHLPFLDETANLLDWQELTKDIHPPEYFKDIYVHMLEENGQRELFVAWVKEFIPEEVHYDLLESFLILEGSCTCYITGADGSTRTVRLGEGDFFTMQIGEHHDLQITSSRPAKAIIQWKKLAA
jgi:mannose-6-phosphate isomerase-like protein (cupin superfamily)